MSWRGKVTGIVFDSLKLTVPTVLVLTATLFFIGEVELGREILGYGTMYTIIAILVVLATIVVNSESKRTDRKW